MKVSFIARKFFLFILLSMASFAVRGTHIVGGELYYKYLGNNQYQLQLTVYRDCYNGVPPFDFPAYVAVWDASNNLITSINLFPNDSATVPPIINSPCFIPPTNVCYRVCNYYGTITLPPRPGGYQLAYQRCCRNQTIINIVNPLNTGATIYATIPGSPILNSNPKFNLLPPPFICAGLPFVFDHSATDLEGDSLVYEICNPYDGADQNIPVLDTGSISQYPPPFQNVIFQNPFNLGNLLGGAPLSIDPQTGLLTATPNTIGQFVIGICVNEYRNGVLLSKSRRDYQLNVVPCPTLVVAALQTPLLTCGSNTVQFSNSSFGASSYFWNFGDPTTLADTSHLVNPSYTYADTGSYNVTLIAYSSFNSGCADTTTGQVTLLPEYVAGFSYALNPCSSTVSFDDSSNTASGPTSQWSWNFGDGSPLVTTSDPTHTFPGPGTYTITLQVQSSRGCRKTLTQTITIPPFITAQTATAQNGCAGTCSGSATLNTNNGTLPFQYLWSDPSSQTTPTATGLCPGTYTVTVTDSNGCSVTATATVTDPLPLVASTSATDAYCNGLCIGSATVSQSGGVPAFTYSWNDPLNQTTPTAVNLCPGWYTVVITDKNNCTATDSVEVLYSTFVPPLDAVISNDTIYAGDQVQLNAIASGTFTYEWTPTDGLSNPNIANPTVTPTGNTTWYVTITDANGCTNIDSVSLVVKQVLCAEPEIFIPNAFTPNGDQSNDLMVVRGNTIRELLFRIYDRWGEKVFETTVPGEGWDGTYKGKKANPAVYVYYVEATCFGNEKFFKKGNITLIR